MKKLTKTLAFALIALSNLSNLTQAAQPVLNPKLAAADRYAKLSASLNDLNLVNDTPLWPQLKNQYSQTQTLTGLNTVLKYLDGEGIYQRYSTTTPQELIVYKDRDTKKVEEFKINLKTTGTPDDPQKLINNLKLIQKNDSKLPLANLRIACDAGHLSGPVNGKSNWDNHTGKFVEIADAKTKTRVSEGEITYLTCLVLAQELKKLGANVLLTRENPGPVTNETIASFPFTPYADRAALQSLDSPWFDLILTNNPLGKSLTKLMQNDLAGTGGNFYKIYQPSLQREIYFIHQVDLIARAEKINAFKPNLVIIVHFDAANRSALQASTNEIRGYVAGNVLNQELASAEQRAQATETLLNGHRWLESAVFTKTLVEQISVTTKVKVKTDPLEFFSKKVSDGVFARNLALTRWINQGAMAYLETLRYDHVSEFYKLAKKDRFIQVGPNKIDYSSRIDDIVEGLVKGIQEYVRSI